MDNSMVTQYDRLIVIHWIFVVSLFVILFSKDLYPMQLNGVLRHCYRNHWPRNRNQARIVTELNGIHRERNDDSVEKKCKRFKEILLNAVEALHFLHK